MANKQHSSITDPDIHEPKNITSANADEVYVADGAGSGVWTPAKELPVPSLWENWEDSAKTSGSPLALTASTRTKLTINGSGTGNDVSQGIGDPLWDTINNKITPLLEGDAYFYRLRFKVLPGAADGYITFQLDVGGGLGVILEETKRYLKGAVEQSLIIDSSIYVGSTFIANGGEIYLTSSVNASIYDVGLFLTRIHRAN